MDILPRETVKDNARKFLEKQLASLKPGEQLPPIRMMMRESGIGRIRIDSILTEFESHGWINRYPGKGVFRADTTDGPVVVPYVDLIACGLNISFRDGSSFFSELITMFSTEAAKTHQGIRLHEIPSGEPISSYEMLFRRPDVKACVLIGLHSPYLTEIFDRHEVAWVSLFSNSSYNQRRTIIASNNVVKLQLEHLWSLGHEKIAYLHGVSEQTPSRALALRRESYYRLMAEQGFKVYPDWVCYTSYKDVDIEKACETVFSAEVQPTAIIVPDPTLPAVYRFIERKGLRIGRDISIVANDDLSIAKNISPAATSVHTSMELVIKRTLESLRDVISGKEVPDIYELPANIVVRESTAPIGQSLADSN